MALSLEEERVKQLQEETQRRRQRQVRSNALQGAVVLDQFDKNIANLQVLINMVKYLKSLQPLVVCFMVKKICLSIFKAFVRMVSPSKEQILKWHPKSESIYPKSHCLLDCLESPQNSDLLLSTSQEVICKR